MCSAVISHWTLWIPGIPKPQPRVKAAVRGGRAMVYTPGTAAAWRENVHSAARRHFDVPLDGPVDLNMDFRLPRPKSHYRTGKHAGELKKDAPLWCVQLGDWDNFGKAVGDAIEGVVYVNDKQVVRCNVSKLYVIPGGAPGMFLSIWRLNE